MSVAVYILNRLPSVRLHGASPFERLFPKAPNLYHFRVFGSLCYATDVKRSDKFAPKPYPTVHLGYILNSKGISTISSDF